MIRKAVCIFVMIIMIATSIFPFIQSMEINDSSGRFAWSDKGNNLNNEGIVDFQVPDDDYVELAFLTKYEISGSNKGQVLLSSDYGSNWYILDEYSGTNNNASGYSSIENRTILLSCRKISGRSRDAEFR